jgi:uncharacterized protein (TIGR02391 family)
VSDSNKRPESEEVDHLLSVIFERFARTGEWPVVGQLRHELDQADDDIDVLAAGRAMDPNLGTVGLSHGDRASLTLHGIARCPGSEEVLEDLLRTMQLAYRRFRAQGIDARIGSDDLIEELGLSTLRVRRTYELMWTLPGIGGGSGSSAESWMREVTPDITTFKRAQTGADLLAAAPERRRPSGSGANPQSATATPLGATSTATMAEQLVKLHPRIASVAQKLFRDGHYAQASFEALKAVELALRERSGLDLSGRELAEKALAGDPPRLAVSRHRGRTGSDEQEGVRFLFMGAMQGLRNPGGHELAALDRQEAIEQLAVAGLLMRWLDTSRRSNRRAAKARPKRQGQVTRLAHMPRTRELQPTRLVLLGELRDMSHRQARTSAILELDLATLAATSGIEIDRLQDALVDLLAEGLVEPYAATLGKSAEQGACRITGAGVRELDQIVQA